MCHRLIPMLQNSSYMFPETWSSKWNVVDTSFRSGVTFREPAKRAVGSAIIELVSKKFVLGTHNVSFEGQEQSNLDKKKNNTEICIEQMLFISTAQIKLIQE